MNDDHRRYNSEVEKWLHTMPGYRTLIRERISNEQKRRMGLDKRLLKINDTVPWKSKGKDVDKLGREVEGCG
jgi:hypothetical protein